VDPSQIVTPQKSAVALAPLDQTFLLNSKPSASKTIYLDFNGHVTENTIWNFAFNHGNPFTTPAYTLDANPAFSNDELSAIQSIWARVSEDYSIYDVNVTTQDPGIEALRRTSGFDENYGVRMVVGGAYSQWFRQPAGGVAYIGSFNWDGDIPAFAFSQDLGGGYDKYVGDAISHEAGHTLGLSHDGTTTGCNGPCGYYSGNGNWAPIMGVGYYVPIVQWSKGEYANANQKEDDLQVMLNYGMQFNPDDHGDQNAPTYLLTSAQIHVDGLITDQNDVDVFEFLTGTGTINIDILSARPDPNLLLNVKILNENLQEVINATNDIRGMNINGQIDEGLYYLVVTGIGQGNPLTTGFSDYGSIGQYTIDATLIDPNATFPPVARITASATQGLAPLSIQFSAQTSSDVDGVITEYVWDFGDGQGVVSGMDVDYTFNQIGLYTVTLTVKDDSNETHSTSIQVTAQGAPQAPSTLAQVVNCVPRQSQLANVLLTWQDQSFNEDQFEVWFKDLNQNQDFEKLVTLGRNINRYEILIDAGTAFEYKVRAVNAFGSSDFSNTVSAVAHVLPTTPLTLVASTTGANQIALSWNEITNETGFIVERAFNNRWITLATISADLSNYQDLNLAKASTYRYKIKAIGACQYVGQTSEIVSATTYNNPPVPTMFSGQVISSSQIDLSWVDLGVTETAYELHRSTSSRFATYTTIALAADVTSYQDQNLPYGKTFYYRLRAQNAAGYSNYTPTVTLTTLQVLPNAPTSPALAITQGKVKVMWRDLSDNEQGFLIERSKDAFVTIDRSFTSRSNTIFVLDATGLEQGTNYFYRISAYNAIGTSAPTAITEIFMPWKVPPKPVDLLGTAISDTQIDLTWVDANGAELAFELQRASNARFSSGLVTIPLASNTTSYSDTSVIHGRTYYYRIRAVNGAGASAYSAVTTVNTPQIIPADPGPVGLAPTRNRIINVSWVDRSDNEQSFIVERSRDQFITIDRSITVRANLNFVADNAGLISGQVYFYRVKAVNQVGSSNYTEIQSTILP
jgi:PKD repeat protein